MTHPRIAGIIVQPGQFSVTIPGHFSATINNLGPSRMVAKARLYETFQAWCEEIDEAFLHSEESFGRELRIASGYTVDAAKPRINGKQVHHYTGITLKPEWSAFGY